MKLHKNSILPNGFIFTKKSKCQISIDISLVMTGPGAPRARAGLAWAGFAGCAGRATHSKPAPAAAARQHCPRSRHPQPPRPTCRRQTSATAAVSVKFS